MQRSEKKHEVSSSGVENVVDISEERLHGNGRNGFGVVAGSDFHELSRIDAVSRWNNGLSLEIIVKPKPLYWVVGVGQGWGVIDREIAGKV